MVCRTRQLRGTAARTRRARESGMDRSVGRTSAAVQAEDRRAPSRRPAASRARSTLVAVSKTFDATGDPPGDRGRPARLRREPRAGSARQMAGAEGGISGHRAAPDRPAAIQQGEGGGGAVRRDRDGRPREDRRRACQGNRKAGQGAAALRPGQHRLGAAEGRHRAARGGRVRRRAAATCTASRSTG